MAPDTHDSVPDEPGMFAMPPRLQRFVQIVGWDGALPLVVGLGPIAVRAVGAQPRDGIGLILVLAPPIAALIRAHIGWHQIARRCGGRAPWLRQVAMAMAIILLLFFEGAVGILTFNDRLPVAAWAFPVGFYALYLGTISLALRPLPDSSPEN